MRATIKKFQIKALMEKKIEELVTRSSFDEGI
jgi:hypothetical protein